MSDRLLPFDPPEGGRLERQFRQFHADNPHIYQKFVEYALFVKHSGRTRFSADAIFHRLRWFAAFETNDNAWGGFKLNDHYTAYYARLAMENEADLEGFFETRVLLSTAPQLEAG